MMNKMGYCISCPDVDAIHEYVKIIFDNNQITSVQLKTWNGTDSFTIVPQVLPADDFLDNLCTALDILKYQTNG